MQIPHSNFEYSIGKNENGRKKRLSQYVQIDKNMVECPHAEGEIDHEKIGYFERQYNQYADKYCKKHGRVKFLEVFSKHFGHYLALTIVNGIVALLYLGGGWLAYSMKRAIEGFPNYIWFFSLGGVWLLMTIVWALRLPIYKKKSKEYEEELLNNREMKK